VLTSHLVGFDLLTISSKAWNAMSPDLQKKFQAAADAAIDFSTEKHLAREKELVEFFKGKGMKLYEPDIDAFRKYAQEKYSASELAKDWPAGWLDKINAL
jgi:TRAP-type C4-dicarboxylate transport system substrate-binding protein